MTYRQAYEQWCTDEYFDKCTREELLSVYNNDEEIKDRFCKNLDFGTGGIRGVIGNGTNRINIYTIRRVTQGLANYILKSHGADKSIVIAYDSRNMSYELALETARCLCSNGIKVYIFDSLRPTPVLSFAVRELKCLAGIMITASHNPAKYNGYKVYWEDGAQITYPLDKRIMQEIEKLDILCDSGNMTLERAKNLGLYNIIESTADDEYIAKVKSLMLNPGLVKEFGKNLKVVYTPLHGTGNVLVRRLLKEIGINNVYVVKEQAEPDGNFSTVKTPNPEDDEAFDLALKLARSTDADIVLATDPDADRLGVYVKDYCSGEYIRFNGNMTGMILLEYICSQRENTHSLPQNGAIVQTIVTTDMSRAIAREYGLDLCEVLTGFKYIGQKIKEFEESNLFEYVFGLEESCGYLAGSYTRDKDAVAAVMLLCEAALYYKSKNETLSDALEKMYQKYGYFKEELITLNLNQFKKSFDTDNLMNKLRENIPCEISNFKVNAVRDYKIGARYDIKTGKKTKLSQPASNVIYYELSEDSWFCIRPSGTEPKIKLYFGTRSQTKDLSKEKLDNLKKALLSLLV